MFTRPPSSALMAMRKPWPSSPIRFAAGTRQSSNWTMAVGWEFQPSLRSWAPNDSPGVPFSTRTVEMPFGPSAPVRHITR